MKLKARILSACLILSILVTACGNTNGNLDTENVSVEDSGSDLVTSSSEKVEAEDVVAEPEFTEEELAWMNAMMPKVEDSLNVRVEPSAEADLAGQLSIGDRAEVVEAGEEWTKIKSGNLEGYVKNDYCIFGLDALAYARETCATIATTITEGLRIREEMSTESKIIKRLEEGQELVVDTTAEVEDGWVAVKYKDNTYYVSAEYVTIGLKVGTGETVEEIAERIAAEEAAKKAEEEARREEEEREDSNDGGIAANVSDMDLMAAIIYCEAGGEPYETQLAVGAVIVNRIQSSKFPNTLYEVLYQRGQFTPAMTGKLERVLREGRATSSCYRAAEEAFSGVDNTNGCLFFNDYNGTKEGIRYGGMVFWW